MTTVRLRTGIWFNDHVTTLTFPDAWDIRVYAPETPPPLSNARIKQLIQNPVGQPQLTRLAAGCRRPVIIVDDLNRPTPVYRLLPFVLEDLETAGIPPTAVRIVVATGTHGPQDPRALKVKLGADVVNRCRIVIHDDRKNTSFVGRTSFGTPVLLNREVLASDLRIGIGGVYPQHSAGFGGGAKLALGVLGRRSIIHLHYGRTGAEGAYTIDHDLRRDLTEIARLIRLNTIYTVHVDANLEIVNLMCGDHFAYYEEAADFSRKYYTAPAPDDADVVVANGYPFDSSFLFMRKAYRPLDLGQRRATKIVVASNYGGLGTHGLFPHMHPQRFHRSRTFWRRLSTLTPRQIATKVWWRAWRLVWGGLRRRRRPGGPPADEELTTPDNTRELLVYRPDPTAPGVPPIPGLSIVHSWGKVIDRISREQGSTNPRVRIYACAGLQCVERPGVAPSTRQQPTQEVA